MVPWGLLIGVRRLDAAVAKLLLRARRTNELFHHGLGNVDTPARFEVAQLMMAERVWAPMLVPDSCTCGNCHSFKVMVQPTVAGSNVTPRGERGTTVSPV